MTAPDLHRTVDAVWRIEAPKLIAALTRIVRDVGVAEDLAQDALVSALEQWPEAGIPRNPGAWLMAAAKHRAIDQFRRNRRLGEKLEQIGRDTETEEPDPTAALTEELDDEIGDDVLRLVFMTCHPVLSRAARVALTLRVFGGLSTPEIARAFLLPEPTVAQRIVRAKKRLAAKNIQFELPPAEELAERLASVLEVIYLVFNEGYAATSGDDWTRPDLSNEAMRLGRILARLAPAEPEVHGLVALMELQASRFRARSGPSGEIVLLMDQDRSRWDSLLIRRGLAALARGNVLGPPAGPYLLQAEIAACHARARRAEDTDWPRIAALYQQLGVLTRSPVVELNRAVALGMAFGPEAGLQLADALAEIPAMQTYHPLPSVRGDLLQKLGRLDEARAEFERAAALTQNAREQESLLARARECADSV